VFQIDAAQPDVDQLDAALDVCDTAHQEKSKPISYPERLLVTVQLGAKLTLTLSRKLLSTAQQERLFIVIHVQLSKKSLLRML
jgi:hypothetical protein